MYYLIITIAILIIGTVIFLLSPKKYYDLNRAARRWKYKVNIIDYVKLLFSPLKEEEGVKILAVSKNLEQQITVEDLIMYNSFNVDLESCLTSYKKLYKAEIKVSEVPENGYKKILDFATKGGDEKTLTEVMLKAHNTRIDLTIDEVLAHIYAKGDIKKAIELVIEAQHSNIPLSFNELTEHIQKGGELDKQITGLIKLNRAGITTSPAQMRKFYTAHNTQDLVEILIDAKNNDITLSMEELLAFPKELGVSKAVNILIKLQRAGITDTNLQHIIEYSNVRDINELLPILSLVKSSPVELNVSFEDLKSFPEKKDINKAINLLINARQVGVDISLNDLKEHMTIGGDIEKFVIAAIKAKEEELDLSIKDIKDFYYASKENNSCNIEEVVELLIKSKNEKLGITILDLRKYLAEKGDIRKIVNALIVAKQEKLDISYKDLEKHFHQGGDVEEFVRALRISVQQGFNYTKEKLIRLHNRKSNVLDLVRALRLNKREELGIAPEDIEKVFNEGVNIIELIYALINAKHSGLNIDYHYAVAIERAKTIGIAKAVKWAIHPQILKIPEFIIVAKDGIQLKIKAEAKVRGKIKQFFGGAGEDIVCDRVRAAIASQSVSYETHKEARANRDKIATVALEMLQKEDSFNNNSSLEILDVIIPIIEPGKNTNENLEKEQAELNKIITEIDAEKREKLIPILEKEAEIKLTEEKANKEKHIGEAFKAGTIKSNEYYKYLTNQK